MYFHYPLAFQLHCRCPYQLAEVDPVGSSPDPCSFDWLNIAFKIAIENPKTSALD
jgi:hypothetical protein